MICDLEGLRRGLFGRIFLDLDEFVPAGDLLNDFIDRLVLAFEDGIGDATGIQPDGARRIVVARDDVIDALRAVIGVNHADDRNAQLVGLGNGDLVVADVDDELTTDR